MTDYNEKIEIEKLLKELPAKIEAQAKLSETLRVDYMNAKAHYKATYRKAHLLAKAKNAKATQSDLKATAEDSAEIDRLAYLTAQSKYEMAKIVLERLRDELDNTRELSYNYRAGLKRLGN